MVRINPMYKPFERGTTLLRCFFFGFGCCEETRSWVDRSSVFFVPSERYPAGNIWKLRWHWKTTATRCISYENWWFSISMLAFRVDNHLIRSHEFKAEAWGIGFCCTESQCGHCRKDKSCRKENERKNWSEGHTNLVWDFGWIEEGQSLKHFQVPG